MAETVSLDPDDKRVLHALQIDGRASFARIATALGMTERSVSRRYHRLRSRLALRVVAVTHPDHGQQEDWFLRVSPTRGSADAVARLLAGRPDTSWVASLAGDGGIACFVRTHPEDAAQAGVIERLRRSSGVASVTAQLVLAPFAGVGGWPGRLEALTSTEIEALSPEPSMRRPGRRPLDWPPLSEDDRRLLRLLAVDGRMSFAHLARAAEIPETTVRRRVADLGNSGVLMFEVEVDPSLYGRRVDVLCWMDAQPQSLAAVTGALAGHTEVAFASTTTGATSIVAILELADAADLDRYLTERLGALSGIRRIETDVAVRWLKRAGPIIRSR